MIFDVFIAYTASDFLTSLSEPEQQECRRIILDVLCKDPFPDGVTKVYLPMPYAPGTIGFEHGEFWFAYIFENPSLIRVAAIYWSPDSPLHPVNRLDRHGK